MKLRILIILLLTVNLLAACQKGAQDSIEVDGKLYLSGDDFVVLDQRLNFDNSTSANVIEFFWYGCPHCQVFEDGDLGITAAETAGMFVTDVRPHIKYGEWVRS